MLRWVPENGAPKKIFFDLTCWLNRRYSRQSSLNPRFRSATFSIRPLYTVRGAKQGALETIKSKQKGGENMAKQTKIKALVGFAKATPNVVINRGTAVQTGLAGNANFPTPPVDLAVLKTNIDSLSALVSESLDGSKKVIAQKNKQREIVIEMYWL
jgi:hypothetical protein